MDGLQVRKLCVPTERWMRMNEMILADTSPRIQMGQLSTVSETYERGDQTRSSCNRWQAWANATKLMEWDNSANSQLLTTMIYTLVQLQTIIIAELHGARNEEMSGPAPPHPTHTHCWTHSACRRFASTATCWWCSRSRRAAKRMEKQSPWWLLLGTSCFAKLYIDQITIVISSRKKREGEREIKWERKWKAGDHCIALRRDVQVGRS